MIALLVSEKLKGKKGALKDICQTIYDECVSSNDAYDKMLIATMGQYVAKPKDCNKIKVMLERNGIEIQSE